MDIPNHMHDGSIESLPEHNRLERIKKYISENLSSDLSLGMVADIFKISSSSLRYIFNKYQHQSYQQYVEGVRMKKAYELLTKDEMIIKEVMSVTGYKIRSTFYRAFIKHFKKPPHHFLQ